MKHFLTSQTPFDPRGAAKGRPQKMVRRLGQAHSHLAGEILRLHEAGESSVDFGGSRPVKLQVFRGLWQEGVNQRVEPFEQFDTGWHAVKIRWYEPEVVPLKAAISVDPSGLIIGQAMSPPFAVEVVQHQESQFDRVQRELSRLQDGWAGPETLAPSPAVLKDLGSLIAALPSKAKVPDFEVDGGDGTITLVWHKESVAFSLIVLGNGKVVGVMSPSQTYKSWTLPIVKEAQIADKLEDERLSGFFGL